MKARRRFLYYLADAFEAAAEDCRRMAARKERPRPLAFETDGQRMLREITEVTMRRFAADAIFATKAFWDVNARRGGAIKIRPIPPMDLYRRPEDVD